MAAPQIVSSTDIIPTAEDVSKILTSKIKYEAAQKLPNKDEWNKGHFSDTPWGIAYIWSKYLNGKKNKYILLIALLAFIGLQTGSKAFLLGFMFSIMSSFIFTRQKAKFIIIIWP